MTLPMDTLTITVTGHFEDMQGNHATGGNVTFTPNLLPLSDTGDEVIFYGVPIVANVDASTGEISVVLPTTDQWTPSSWAWNVSENISFSSGSFNRSYLVQIPSSLGSTVDLVNLAPLANTPQTYSYLPSGGGVISGDLTVTGVLNSTGDIMLSGDSQIANVFPTGDTTGANDVANIQAALNANAGGAVQLAAGLFYTDKPLIIPPFTSLSGAPDSTLVSEGYNGGTTLQPVAAFSSSLSINSVIALLGQLDASPNYSTASEEQKIINLQINGASGPASLSGIACYGNAGRVRILNVLISQMTGDGVQQNIDGSSNGPDAWQMDTCNVRYCTGRGYVLRSSDSVYRNCKSSNNCGNGEDADWIIQTTSNSKYIDCSSEHSGAVGFSFVCKNAGTDSGRVLFQGCQTDQSALHGFEIGGTFNSQTSNTAAFPVLLSGCLFGRDGQNAGSGGDYAGIYVNAYGASSGGLVMLAGCHVWPGYNDDGSGVLAPNYGLWVQGESKVNITGGSYFAATGGTAIFNDSTDGANVINYDTSVAIGVGATATMSVNMAPAVATPTVQSLTVFPASAPGTDPIFVENQNSGERQIGTRVSGESNDKVKITSDGVIHLGPGGSTSTDTSIQRTSSATLTISNNVTIPDAMASGSAAVTGEVTAGSAAVTGNTATGSLTVAGNVINDVQPADLGYLGWTYNAISNTDTGTGLLAGVGGAGVIYLCKIPLYGQSISTTGMRVQLTSAGSSLTASECWVYLFDSSGNFKGATADQSTAWEGSTGVLDANWASGPLTVQGAFCWVGFTYNGTTEPSFMYGNKLSASFANGKLTNATSAFGTYGSGYTSNSPGNITVASIVQRATAYWVALF